MSHRSAHAGPPKKPVVLRDWPALDGSGHNRRRPNVETTGEEATKTGRRRFNFDARTVLKSDRQDDQRCGGDGGVRGYADCAISMRGAARQVAVSHLEQSGEHYQRDAQQPEIRFSLAARV
jgi:hypothetical protein